jgi:hypothetical protein
VYVALPFDSGKGSKPGREQSVCYRASQAGDFRAAKPQFPMRRRVPHETSNIHSELRWRGLGADIKK